MVSYFRDFYSNGNYTCTSFEEVKAIEKKRNVKKKKKIAPFICGDEDREGNVEN